jgi:tRNA 2-thiocytidine biosynthesis protein TtcA
LFPIHIDPGFAGGVADNLVEYCKSLDYMLTMDYTDHGPMAHNIGNRENPCFLCSKLRRKRLFEISDRLGCNKLALAHHKDDIIETFFMNICYSGEISTMVPKQQFFNGKLHLIRPLAYTDESTIQQFARSINLPEFINPCPSSGTSRRREMRTFLDRLYESNRKIKGNIFSAMSRVKQDYLLKRAKL